MKLNNANQIKSEDYDKEYSNLVDQLAETINPFMQEVVELADDRIDFENRVEVLKTFDITVDSAGIPVLNDKIATGKGSSGIRGMQVISSFNLTVTAGYPTSQPYINYTVLAGGFARINTITGLLANNKYKLTVIIY
jgi:hypothetical protein